MLVMPRTTRNSESVWSASLYYSHAYMDEDVGSNLPQLQTFTFHTKIMTVICSKCEYKDSQADSKYFFRHNPVDKSTLHDWVKSDRVEFDNTCTYRRRNSNHS